MKLHQLAMRLTNGGTTGGKGGSTITVSSLNALNSDVAGDSPAIAIVSGTISGKEAVKVGSNKSILGENSSANESPSLQLPYYTTDHTYTELQGVGLAINGNKNVIVRKLSINKILAFAGDAIGIQKASNVWIDHCDLSSDVTHDKDYYDGLLDITHACEWVTVSNCPLHNHFKASLVGHSDNNGSEDRGHLHVTFANNYWSNINSRGPSYRFGTGHVFNSYYENVSDGINTRQGAQMLIEGNVWVNSKKPLYGTDGGYAVARGNDFGGQSDTASQGSLTSVPYKYVLLGSGNVKSSVVANAGQKLSF